ncbi:MAG: hypothetical protein H6607_02765 [Flavobacteriales bacterium]|nr:hypothetical protein [Flavobacteriales bacterium]
MGQRISYFKNNYDKGLKELLFDNYSTFRQWYLDFDKSSMEEFNQPFGNEGLKEYFNQNKDLQADFATLDKKFIDELTSEFIGIYYDLTHQHNDILDFFGPTMSVWRYDASNKMVSSTKDKDFIELWTFITKGRSLKDNLQFDSFTNDYKIGFINRQEYLVLKNKIELYFGDIETMRRKHWTNKEKAQLEKAIESSKDGSYSLSGHNPKSSGLEYMLDAINELTEKNKELITGIE